MNVQSIKPEVFPTGLNAGIPCVIILLGGDTDMSSNQIVDAVRKLNLNTLCISGNIQENPECRTIAKDFCGIGYEVIMLVDASDSIEPLRMIKGLRFSIKIKAPTETENDVNPKNLPLLKEADELIFKIEFPEDYEAAITFLQSKLITRPTASLMLGTFGGKNEVIAKYLEFAGKFIYNTRCYV